MRVINTLLFVFISISSFAQQFNYATISNKVLEEIEANPEAFHSIYILLEDRVDVQAMDQQFYAQRASQQERIATLLPALQIKALSSQTALLDFLNSSDGVLSNSIRSFWITNVIFAQVQKEVIAELSMRHDVEWIGKNGKLELEAYEKVEMEVASNIPGGIESGLEAIKAPFMWNMGYTGYGQLAFTMDTGVESWHPAIINQFRGNYDPIVQTWYEYDEQGMQQLLTSTPFDCGNNVHGTHVTGTILGLERVKDDTIGVAFNAQWIGSAILCGIGTIDNITSFEWALNPDGNINTIEDIPDVINNSWRDSDAGMGQCNGVYYSVFEALEAAGIAVIFSAGNEGDYGEMTITPPKNININLVNCFAVGALNGNTNNLPIANFSSIGPSICGGDSSLLIKPEVSAPGVSVRSCSHDGGYGTLSGTSMAAPHVSGAILLLKEAFPFLSGKELKEAIYFSCTDLGEPGEDNTFGMGIIDVESAYNYLINLGHEPIPPVDAFLDVMLVDIKFPSITCDNEFTPTLIIENVGSESISSFEINFNLSNGISGNQIWTGNLNPNENIEIILSTIEVTEEWNESVFTIEKPNGLEDQRPLNNKIKKIDPVQLSSFEKIKAWVVGLEDSQAPCFGSSALLRASHPIADQSVFKWYNKAESGLKLGEGELFQTEPLMNETTFYVDATHSGFIGPKNNNFGEIITSQAAEIGVVFDALEPFTIKSFEIYAEDEGTSMIVLVDSDGEIIKQKLVQIPEIGFQRIEIGMTVERGNNLVLYKWGSKPLKYNSSGANYPYQIEGIATIKGHNDLNASDDAYFFFYDWEIEYQEPCGRTPITVPISQNGDAPIASFSVSADSINLDSGNGEITFTDNSQDAESWHWDFGDGNASTETSPTHTYTEIGTYYVSLTVLNADGCPGSVIDTIEVTGFDPTPTSEPIKNDKFLVFPNPTSDIINVYFELEQMQQVELTLVDLYGRTLQNVPYQSIQEGSIELNLQGLSSGFYYLLLKIDDKLSIQKVLKN